VDQERIEERTFQEEKKHIQPTTISMTLILFFPSSLNMAAFRGDCHRTLPSASGGVSKHSLFFMVTLKALGFWKLKLRRNLKPVCIKLSIFIFFPKDCIHKHKITKINNNIESPNRK
jgi:hypothetical protein